MTDKFRGAEQAFQSLSVRCCSPSIPQHDR